MPKLILKPLLTDAVHFLEDFHGLHAVSAMYAYIIVLSLSPRYSTFKHYEEELTFATTATMYYERERENHGSTFG
jgi:hypothetical protein